MRKTVFMVILLLVVSNGLVFARNGGGGSSSSHSLICSNVDDINDVRIATWAFANNRPAFEQIVSEHLQRLIADQSTSQKDLEVLYFIRSSLIRNPKYLLPLRTNKKCCGDICQIPILPREGPVSYEEFINAGGETYLKVYFAIEIEDSAARMKAIAEREKKEQETPIKYFK